MHAEIELSSFIAISGTLHYLSAYYLNYNAASMTSIYIVTNMISKNSKSYVIAI